MSAPRPRAAAAMLGRNLRLHGGLCPRPTPSCARRLDIPASYRRQDRCSRDVIAGISTLRCLHSRPSNRPSIVAQHYLQAWKPRPTSLVPFSSPPQISPFSSTPTPEPLTLSRRFRPYVHLSRLHAPIGSLLLFLPCSWSLALSATSHSLPPTLLLGQTLLFLTGAVVMRGAGCTINDLWDRRYDALVERTRNRPLASGEVGTLQAITWLGMQLSAGLAVLLQLNWNSILLGASSLGLVIIYPLMKRITYWPQFVLGLAFNWGALLGSSALLGAPDWPVVLPLYFGSVLWTLHYDTIYAHQDAVDDVSAGVKSTALLFGPRFTKPALSCFSAGFIGLLAFSGLRNGVEAGFYVVGCGGATMHLLWQIWKVRLAERASCWKMFGANVTTGLIVWAGCLVDYLTRVLLV